MISSIETCPLNFIISISHKKIPKFFFLPQLMRVSQLSLVDWLCALGSICRLIYLLKLILLSFTLKSYSLPSSSSSKSSKTKSILRRKNSLNSMSTASTPFFHEFRKQASFFLKEKIKSARLALTDATPIQLLTEDAVRGDQSAPDTQTLGRISKAAFEVDEYWRIVDMLHNRLSIFERKNWRVSYNCLIVLEHLLTHGPESVAEEFQNDKEVISQTGGFQYIDEKGFNWGLAVRRKSERVMKLLEQGPLLKEERDRARKLTRGIQGFGSFSHTASSTQGILKESSLPSYARSNSDFNPVNQFSEEPKLVPDSGMETPGSGDRLADGQEGSAANLKENVEPPKEDNANMEECHRWNCIEPSRSLLKCEKQDLGNRIDEAEDHPFSDTEHRTSASLLQ